MLLAVDIGNTDIVLGIYDGQSWIAKLRHPSNANHKAVQLFQQFMREQQLPLSSFEKVILSSVVPTAQQEVKELLATLLPNEILLMDPHLYEQIDMAIDKKEEIGADLVANAVAAYHRFGQACIVIDFGTALSFTCIDDEGKILGVSIAPGLNTAMKSLFSNTARLPEVPLVFPDSAIGKNTEHALQAGILIGYVGLIRELIAWQKKEMQTSVKTVATGGLSHVLEELKNDFDVVDKELTLDGLRIIAEKYG